MLIEPARFARWWPEGEGGCFPSSSAHYCWEGLLQVSYTNTLVTHINLDLTNPYVDSKAHKVGTNYCVWVILTLSSYQGDNTYNIVTNKKNIVITDLLRVSKYLLTLFGIPLNVIKIDPKGTWFSYIIGVKLQTWCWKFKTVKILPRMRHEKEYLKLSRRAKSKWIASQLETCISRAPVSMDGKLFILNISIRRRFQRTNLASEKVDSITYSFNLYLTR